MLMENGGRKAGRLDDQFLFQHVSREFHVVSQVELLEDACLISGDGRHAQRQVRSDFDAGLARDDQSQDLQLLGRDGQALCDRFRALSDNPDEETRRPNGGWKVGPPESLMDSYRAVLSV